MSMPVTKGLLEKVTCPWPGCGFELDFSETPMVEAGSICSCDKCKRMIEVVSRRQITVIAIRGTNVRPAGFRR